jgi:hypothetical protein
MGAITKHLWYICQMSSHVDPRPIDVVDMWSALNLRLQYAYQTWRLRIKTSSSRYRGKHWVARKAYHHISTHNPLLSHHGRSRKDREVAGVHGRSSSSAQGTTLRPRSRYRAVLIPRAEVHCSARRYLGKDQQLLRCRLWPFHRYPLEPSIPLPYTRLQRSHTLR